MNNDANTLWDPLNNKVTPQDFTEEQAKLVADYENVRKRPYLLKLYLGTLFILAILTLIAILYTRTLQLIVFFIPLFWYYNVIMNKQENFILYLICQKNNWPYNPGSASTRADDFKVLLPMIFDYGYDQTVEEQLWGNIAYQSGTATFWSCEFQYTTGSGRSTRTHNEYIIIFRVAKPMLVNFSLVKAGLLRIFEEGMKTESAEFNKIFQIQTDSNDKESKEQIIQILSPSVITRLIDFSNSYKTKRITFQGDLMAIVLEHKIWKTKYTNFFKQVSIDIRDETKIYDSLKDMAGLTTKMIQFIK